MKKELLLIFFFFIVFSGLTFGTSIRCASHSDCKSCANDAQCAWCSGVGCYDSVDCDFTSCPSGCIFYSGYCDTSSSTTTTTASTTTTTTAPTKTCKDVCIAGGYKNGQCHFGGCSNLGSNWVKLCWACHGCGLGDCCCETTQANTRPTISKVGYEGKPTPGSTITLFCTASDPDQDVSTLNVRIWIGRCKSGNCIASGDYQPWDVSEATMTYRNNRFEYTWTIPFSYGTIVGATCRATDNQKANSEWGDSYPLFTVGGSGADCALAGGICSSAQQCVFFCNQQGREFLRCEPGYSDCTDCCCFCRTPVTTTTLPIPTSCVDGCRIARDVTIQGCQMAQQPCLDWCNSQSACKSSGFWDQLFCNGCITGCIQLTHAACIAVANGVYTQCTTLCCNDNNLCTTDRWDEANQICVNTPKVCNNNRRDNCCPSGCTKDNDRDCRDPKPTECGRRDQGTCEDSCASDETRISDAGKCPSGKVCCQITNCPERCSQLGYPAGQCVAVAGSSCQGRGSCGVGDLLTCCCFGERVIPTTTTTTITSTTTTLPASTTTSTTTTTTIPSGSCRGRCGQYTQGAPCQCDSSCRTYRDCCDDVCNACPNLPFCAVTTTTLITPTTLPVTTTTIPSGQFTSTGFACVPILGGHRCTLSYNNQLGENAIVLFLYTDSKGRVISAPAPVGKQGSDSVASALYCNSVQPGSYKIFWKAYRESDQNLANEVAWSKTYEIQTIAC